MSFIIVISFIFIIFIAVAFYFIKRGKARRLPGSDGTSRRSSAHAEASSHHERSQGSSMEEQLVRKVKSLIKRNKYFEAARILESRGFVSEAVRVLESGNEVEMAAKMLRQNGALKEAGGLYAKHSMWQLAAHCFLDIADLNRSFKLFDGLNLSPDDLEVLVQNIGADQPAAPRLASFMEEMGSFLNAGTLYEKLNDDERAARCYKAGDYPELYQAALKRVSQRNSESTPGPTLEPSAEKPFETTSKDLPEVTSDENPPQLLEQDDPQDKDMDEVRTLDDMVHVNFLESDLLGELSREEKTDLWKIGNVIDFAAQEVVLPMYAPGEGAFFVLEGQVGKYLSEGSSSVFVQHTAEGSCWGVLWLNKSVANHFKWVAESRTKVLFISQREYVMLAEENNAVAAKVQRMINRHLLEIIEKNPQLKYDLAS